VRPLLRTHERARARLSVSPPTMCLGGLRRLARCLSDSQPAEAAVDPECRGVDPLFDVFGERRWLPEHRTAELARLPEPRRPQRTNDSIPSIFGGEIGTETRRSIIRDADGQALAYPISRAGQALGCTLAHPRRGPADRRHHRQAIDAASTQHRLSLRRSLRLHRPSPIGTIPWAVPLNDG
jgi:hypothetical protein